MIYRLNDEKEILWLSSANGIVPQNTKIGAPDIRTNMYNRPDRDGEIDRTRLMAGLTITMKVGVAHELTNFTHDFFLMDKIKEWMAYGLRYWFEYGPDIQNLRRLPVAPKPWDYTYDDTTNGTFIYPVLQWRSSRGIAEATGKPQTITLQIAGATEGGRTYDREGDRVYPPSTPIGTVPITNYGNYDAVPIVKIYGPATGPAVENKTTGKGIYFKDDFSIQAGEYIEMDFNDPRHVYLNGDPSNPRYDKIDWDISTWFSIVKGPNQLRYAPLSSVAPSNATVSIRDGFLP